MSHAEQQSPAGLELEELHGALPALAFACQADSLAQVAHDARNMATVLDLYCDLLQEPGVLAAPYSHYGGELKHLAATSRALVERLAALDVAKGRGTGMVEHNSGLISNENFKALQCAGRWRGSPSRPIENIAAEVLSSRNFLSALAGSTIGLTVEVVGSALPVKLAGEELTRILVNLVKNAAEAMRSVGRVHISLRENAGGVDCSPSLILNVEDNGPGFPDTVLASIFEHGEDAQTSLKALRGNRHVRQPRLGLSIVRSLVEAAGGRFHAANRDPVGACVQIELPVLQGCVADSSLKETCDSASLN